MFDRFKYKIGDLVCHITSPGFPLVVVSRRMVEDAGGVSLSYYVRGVCFVTGDNAGRIMTHEVSEIEVVCCDNPDLKEIIQKIRDKNPTADE